MSATTVETKPEERTQLAPLWKVVLHDDPVTSFEFVVVVLRTVFAKTANEAYRITREAHDTGAAVADVLPLETAEFRRDQVHSLARQQGFPLTVTLEPAD